MQNCYHIAYLIVRSAASVTAGFMNLTGMNLSLYIIAYSIAILASYTFVSRSIRSSAVCAGMTAIQMTILYTIIIDFADVVAAWFVYVLVSFMLELIMYIPRDSLYSIDVVER